MARVGSYAILTVGFDSWMSEPVVTASQKNKKVKGGNKEIIHKIFADCTVVINDPFWIEKFQNAAIGKFPQKFSYHDGILTYRKGARCITVELGDNPYEAAALSTEFFRTHGGIFSPIDEQNSLEMQYSRAQSGLSRPDLKWEDASKKIQECMISYYIMDMKQQMWLSDREVERLRQCIRLGISGKYFGKQNIRLENNRIHSIDGLLWNYEQRDFYINPELKPNVVRSYARKKDGSTRIDASEKDTIPQFSVKWGKYVDYLDEKVARHNRHQRRMLNNLERLYQLSTADTVTSLTTDDDDYEEDDDEEET